MLTMRQIAELLTCVCHAGEELFEREVDHVGAADLMSDVLTFSRTGFLLLTGQTNPQVIRTAVVAEACGVILVRGKKPSPEMVDLARSFGMPLLTSQCFMFEACGRLFEKGLKPC